MSKTDERIVYEVVSSQGLHGKAGRYNIRFSRGGNNWLKAGPSGRLLSFATMSGAQRRCDRLNADEHKRITAK